MSRFLLLTATLCVTLFVLSQNVLTFAELALSDWRLRFATQTHVESRVVIVDVDERSLAEQGAWPWPREKVAQLLQNLIDDYHVASIALDMVFPESRPNDDALKLQLQRPEVTTAVVYDLERRHSPLRDADLPLPPRIDLTPHVPRMQGVPIFSTPPDFRSAHAGHITPLFDNDGTVRRILPFICADNTAHNCRPSLTLTSFAAMFDHSHFEVARGKGLLAAPWELSLNDERGGVLATIPLEDDGAMVVPYRHHRRDWISVSATDILNHKPDLALLSGSVVLIGGTALGLSDVIATPINSVAAGLEPHAEILSALLDDDFAAVPRWGFVIDALILLPFVALLAWGIARFDQPLRRAIMLPAWLGLAWSAGAILSIAALIKANLLLPMLPLFLFPPLALLVSLSAELYRTGSERASILMLLSTYLPQPVASRLAAIRRRNADVDTAVDATRRQITVLFADVRGFTGVCETASPDTVARLVQRVFTEMAEAVAMHHGTIDKFIGDAIMAFWNAPENDDNHAKHALLAACEIRERIRRLAPFCLEMGLKPIGVGIGIESGEAVVGNFGSAHRRTFTAIGEPVVLASRIERFASEDTHPILIGGACAGLLGTDTLRTLGPFQIRGRSQPLEIYVPNEGCACEATYCKN